ncbi:MAG: hypothetical protein K0S55_1251 [Clostridia bacterium]|nr:hypothetical protein [Clostridia bacterium]
MLKYNEFIEKVNEAGFLTPFTNYFGSEMKDQQYTGDPETDPRVWNTRAAQEKKLACGYFFNGKPGGFIAPHFYSIFVDAFKPSMTMNERYESGKLGEYEQKIWSLLDKAGRPMGWHEFWQHYGINSKEERKELEAALFRLQMTFDVAVSGTAVILKKTGEVLSDCIGYDKVDSWVPSEWMKMNPRMKHEEALEIIYRQAEKISNQGDAQKAFKQSLKLYKPFC